MIEQALREIACAQMRGHFRYVVAGLHCRPKVQAEDHGWQGANSRIHGGPGPGPMGGGGAVRKPR